MCRVHTCTAVLHVFNTVIIHRAGNVIPEILSTIKKKGEKLDSNKDAQGLHLETENLEENVKKSFLAGCNLALHCNGNLKEMLIVAKNSPKIDNFILKKTSQLMKIIS